MPNGAHREYCSNTENRKELETSMDNIIKISALETRIAELEKYSKALEDTLAKAYWGIRELRSQFEFCDCSDDPQDDICINCILGSILRDIEAHK
jgi:hypothetical protein